jgi:hypothetical protein
MGEGQRGVAGYLGGVRYDHLGSVEGIRFSTAAGAPSDQEVIA